MEPIAPYTVLGHRSRYREQLGDGRLGPVERRVETRDLRQFRMYVGKCPNGRKVVGLVQRGKRNKFLQFRNHAVIDQGCRRKSEPTMHHPMARGGDPHIGSVLLDPGDQVLEALGMADGCPFGPAVFANQSSFLILDSEMGRGAETLDLPLADQIGFRGAPIHITGELQARRSGIDDQYGVVHSVHSFADYIAKVSR